jgi:hypothetical protein
MMMKRYREGRWLTAAFAVLCMAVCFPADIGCGFVEASAAVLSGTVVDHNGPVAGVNVRIQGGREFVVTDKAGRFVIHAATAGKAVNISAWKKGYYSVLLKDVQAPKEGVRLELVPYQIFDNDRYEWIPPESVKGSCVECHPAVTEMSLKDAHMRSAQNPRFLTLYYGTDTEGNQSPLTRYEKGRKFSAWVNSMVPLPPDLSKPYYGTGYLLDFPDTVGNCTACHIPGASVDTPIDPRSVTGADRYGAHCDFCHKVEDVHVSSTTGMPPLRRAGVQAMSVRRPFTGDPKRPQLFFGTFEDVNAEAGDTNLPLLRESRYCASCHFGMFWDTVVYNSYGEWLKSPYADSRSGKAKTCQECHMPSPTIYKGKNLTNIAPGKGGIERDPAAIHNHNMTVDAGLLRNSLTMNAKAGIQNGRVLVDVKLNNDKTGHHVPTDSPLRHLILLVEARDARGTALKQLSGPRLPEWCGKGDVNKGHYAGYPGKAYAKILANKWTGEYPTGAYWDHTDIVSDNRLAAFAIDTSTYAFDPPRNGKVQVVVTLLYRRAFITLMEQKKWQVPDIVMARQKLSISSVNLKRCAQKVGCPATLDKAR